MKRFYILSAFVLIVAAGLTVAAQSQQQNQQPPFVPVTDEMLWKPDPANWLMWRRTLDSWGYSPLNEVNRNNVSRLKMVWTRGIGTGRTQEATPLVYNGHDVHPESGRRHHGDRREDWRPACGSTAASTRRASTAAPTATWRSGARRCIDASADNTIYAVDARTGKLVWETPVLKARPPRQRQLGTRSSPTAR